MEAGDTLEIEEEKSTEDWIFCVNEAGANGWEFTRLSLEMGQIVTLSSSQVLCREIM